MVNLRVFSFEGKIRGKNRRSTHPVFGRQCRAEAKALAPSRYEVLKYLHQRWKVGRSVNVARVMSIQSSDGSDSGEAAEN